MEEVLSGKVTINENAVDSRVGEETVILHLDSAIYFGLDEIGTRSWELLKAGKSPAEIIAAIVTDYDVEREVVEADLRSLLEDMQKNGLVEIS